MNPTTGNLVRLLVDVDPHDLDLAVGGLEQAEHGRASSSSCPHHWARSARRLRPASTVEGQVAHGEEVVVIDAKVANGDHENAVPKQASPVVGLRLFAAAIEIFWRIC